MSEIRVGNYHKSDSISIPRLQIQSVEIDGCAFASITEYGIEMVKKGSLKFEPIPISDAWLLRLGFEYDWAHVIFLHVRTDKGVISFSNGDNGEVVCDNEEDESCGSAKYVHELQNLHFDKTGEELILQP